VRFQKILIPTTRKMIGDSELKERFQKQELLKGKQLA